jgi:hypothetical protein
MAWCLVKHRDNFTLQFATEFCTLNIIAFHPRSLLPHVAVWLAGWYFTVDRCIIQKLGDEALLQARDFWRTHTICVCVCVCV